MTRRFRDDADPDEIRRHLSDLGYPTMEPVGYKVKGTGVHLDHDIVVFNENSGEYTALGCGMISLGNDLETSPDEIERSLHLHQRLYRRFRRPPSNKRG